MKLACLFLGHEWVEGYKRHAGVDPAVRQFPQLRLRKAVWCPVVFCQRCKKEQK